DADGVDDGKDDVERQLGPGVERAPSGADLAHDLGDLRACVALPEAIRRIGAAQVFPAQKEERDTDDESDEPARPRSGFQSVVHRPRGGRDTAGASEESLEMVELRGAERDPAVSLEGDDRKN